VVIIILQTTYKHIYYVLEYKEMINMAEQVLVQFRADKALKEEVADIYSQLGMDLPTAFRMFMNKSKQVRGLPFDAVLPPQSNKRDDFRVAFNALREEAADTPEMSLEEINAEISAARSKRKRG
jgi:DNA-damage-inducible protein J